MTSKQAFARTRSSPKFDRAVFLPAIILSGVLSHANAIPSASAEEPERFEDAPAEVSAHIRPGRALPLRRGGAVDYNDGLNGKAEFLLQTTFHRATGDSETQWFEEEVDLDETPVIGFHGVGRIKIECESRGPLDVYAVLTEVDITTSDSIAIGTGAAVMSAPLGPLGSVLIGVIATLVASLPGNDSFGGASEQVPPNGSVVLKFRGPDGAAEVPIEGSTVPVPMSAETGCPPPELPAKPLVVSTPTPDEQAEQIFAPLDNALQLSREADHEPGLGGEALEPQITEIRRSLGAVVLRLGEMIATLTVETANEPDSLKTAAEWIASGRSAIAEGNWDAALADYRRAFVLAAPARDEAQKFELPSELPQRILLLPEIVATTPLRTIAVAGYVTGLSPGEAVEDVEVGQLSIPTNIGPPIVRHERAFGFSLELGDIALDPGTPLEVPVPVTAQLTTGGIAQGELTLIIYARSQDRSEER